MDQHLDRAITAAPSGDAIYHQCKAITLLLLEKNRLYGDSWHDPVRIFSEAPPDEQLKVRIDDKISRILNNVDAPEDTILDLIGYLTLLLIL